MLSDLKDNLIKETTSRDPHLLPNSTGQVVRYEKTFEVFRTFDSVQYTWVECEAVLGDGNSTERCYTFC